MFYYLEGTAALLEQNLCVVDVGGVGYAVNTSMNTLASLKAGARVRVYTYIYIREGIFDIYGFATQEELSCFKMLISISGVGPKAAVSILSATTPEGLALSVITGDEKALTVAPGIGKKIALRIILELKDKMSKEQLESAKADGTPVMTGSAVAEALAALGVLGYSSAEAQAALGGVDLTGLDVAEIVRAALKRLARE